MAGASGRGGAPPRLAERLLELSARQDATGDAIVGDLREEYARQLVRSRRHRADAWYWRQALGVATRCLIDRAMHTGTKRRDRPVSNARRQIEARPGDPMLHSLAHDLRFAARTLRRNPGFAATTALALALGLGANTAIFSVVNAFLLRPLPFADPGRLVHIWETNREYASTAVRAAMPNVEDWREGSRALSDLALFNYTEESITGGDEPTCVSVGRMSANALSLLGVGPLIGRGFVSGEDQPGAAPVAVIGERFWTTRYGRDPRVVGRTIEINDRAYTIVGVMPSGFAFPLNITELWAPYTLDRTRYTRDNRTFQVVARLAPGVTIAQAQAELDVRARELERRYPENDGVGAHVVPLRQALNFADQVLRPMSVLLAAAAGLVLLIACANVASLMLARGTGRSREVAIRTSLGASRKRLVRQLLTESALVSLVGGALGALLAFWAVRTIDSVIPPDIYRVGAVTIDAQALGFTAGVSLIAALLFGLAPAMQTSRTDLGERLRQGGRSASHAIGTRRLHGALVSGQIALALALLVGASLMIQSVRELRNVDPGFEIAGVLTLKLVASGDRFPDAATVAAFHSRVLQEVSAQPGVHSAATVDFLPLNHETNGQQFQVAGATPPTGADPPSAIRLAVTDRYFETMGLDLLRGRSFSESLDRADAPATVIINEEFRRRFLPDGEPIGAVIRLIGNDREVPATIVGVVANARHASLDAAPEAHLFVPQWQRPSRHLRVLVRGDGPPLQLVGAARRSIWTVDPRMPITEIRTLQAVVDEFLLPQRGLSGILVVLAGGALLLAVIGIYGVMAYLVAQRTHEIGIRMALGATSASVLALVLRRGFILTALGVVGGLAGAFALSRLLRGFLFGVTGADPLTYATLPLLLGIVALAACLIPARRAMRVDPVVALREE